MSGRYLAGQVGVTERMVYLWLQGRRRPRATTYWKIAAVLGLDMEVVLAPAGYAALPNNPGPLADDEGDG